MKGIKRDDGEKKGVNRVRERVESLQKERVVGGGGGGGGEEVTSADGVLCRSFWFGTWYIT